MKYTYQSSEKFLSMVQREYESEKERAAALDSKIALSLPVISAYFFLLAQDTRIRELWPFVMDAGYSVASVRQFLSLLFYVIAVFTAFFSLFWMIHATWTRNFEKLDIMRSNNAVFMSMSPELFSARIVTDYLRQVKQDREANEIRSKEYRTGWIFGLASLSGFLLYMMIAQ